MPAAYPSAEHTRSVRDVKNVKVSADTDIDHVFVPAIRDTDLTFCRRLNIVAWHVKIHRQNKIYFPTCQISIQLLA